MPRSPKGGLNFLTPKQVGLKTGSNSRLWAGVVALLGRARSGFRALQKLMRLSPKTSRPFIRFPKPVNLSDFYTGVHIFDLFCSRSFVFIVCQHLASLCYRLVEICYYLAVGLRRLGHWWVTDKRSFRRRRPLPSRRSGEHL